MGNIYDNDFLLRAFTLFLLLARFVYWIITEQQADAEKQKSKKASIWSIIKRAITQLLGVVIGVQLLGLEILPFPENGQLQLLGFIMVVVAVTISIIARRQLGANWTHAAEYQIKQDHELVTYGIYNHIRHPIYTGFTLSVTGAELVVSSYLVLLFLFILLLNAYVQGKKEEGILKKEYGKKYEDYMKRTKMFIPSIW